ncbi:MAG TPA: glycoside hydrolase family 6 protein [Polyangiaceae bacterium]
MIGRRWLCARSLCAGFALLLAAACAGSSAPAEDSSSVVFYKPPPEEPEIEPAPAMPVEAATTPAAPSDVNPFEGAKFYLDPEYAKKVDSTIASVPDKAAVLKKVKGVPTALWLDRIAAVEQVPVWLDDAAKQTKTAGKPVVPVFVVYDLPNRDCSAKASHGELTLENNGEERYRTEFIDKIAEHFAAHSSQRIVAIIEPDSLPNVVTNLDVPKCALSQQLYKNSVAYAIAKLSLPNVHLYLDAAHAGWLGWDGNRNGIADVFKEVLTMAGGLDRVRGFATNVSNYNALEGDFGKKLEPTNPCPNELAYVQKLSETLAAKGVAGKGFIIDTSRNGKADIRRTWGNWCNIKGAGLGERPRVAPVPPVDAYFWVKPPGDADGIADPKAERFDQNCASEDATPGAPEAGHWFESYFLELVENANPPL